MIDCIYWLWFSDFDIYTFRQALGLGASFLVCGYWLTSLFLFGWYIYIYIYLQIDFSTSVQIELTSINLECCCELGWIWLLGHLGKTYLDQTFLGHFLDFWMLSYFSTISTISLKFTLTNKFWNSFIAPYMFYCAGDWVWTKGQCVVCYVDMVIFLFGLMLLNEFQNHF